MLMSNNVVFVMTMFCWNQRNKCRGYAEDQYYLTTSGHFNYS